MKTKKYISYNKYNRQIKKLNLASVNGLKLIIPKNYFKVIVGCSIICISLLTPFTNWVLIPLGLFIIGISLRDIENIKRKIKNKIRGLK